jgi:hypothetical protein
LVSATRHMQSPPYTFPLKTNNTQNPLQKDITNIEPTHHHSASTPPRPLFTSLSNRSTPNHTNSLPKTPSKRPLPPIPPAKSSPVTSHPATSPVAPPPALSKIRHHVSHGVQPPLPPKPRKISSEQNLSFSHTDTQACSSSVREKAVLELVNTERAFVDDMNLLITKFLIPLRHTDILTSGEVIKLFSNVELVAAISKELLNEWGKCLRHPDVENSVLGEVFLQKAKEIASIYKVYCVGHKEAIHLYQEKTKRSSFVSFLEEKAKDPELRRLSLLDFLIKPVQRVCKYPLLLNKLLEATPTTHPDYKPLKEALDVTNQFLEEMNTSAKEAEMFHILIDIESRLSGMPEHLKLTTSGRRFIMDARWTKISGSYVQERHFFMFSDMLVYAKPPVLKKDCYEYKGMCPYHTCTFIDLPDNDEIKNAIGIIRQDSSKKKYVIYTKDPEQKQKWLAALSDATESFNNNNANNIENSNTKIAIAGTKERLTMVQIEERVNGWKNDNSARVYIDEGPVLLLKDGSHEPDKRYFFLFNDALMITKKIKKVSSRTPFQFLKMLHLKSTLLQNIDSCKDGEYEYVFALVAMDAKEKFLVVTATAEEKVKWYNLIVARRNELTGDNEQPISMTMVGPTDNFTKQLDFKLGDARQRAFTLSGIVPPPRSPEKDKSKDTAKTPQFKRRMFSKVGYKTSKEKKETDKEEEEDDSGEKQEAVEGFEVPPWEDDSLYPACESCKTKFTTTFRRLHCRNCGKVFCDNCTSKRCYLPRYGFTKKKVRVCDRCFLVH